MPQFTIELSPTGPTTALEEHLVNVAKSWCASKSITPIDSIDAFQKRLESEAAWFCRDNPEYDPITVHIGQYDETMVFLKPAGRNIRATATIRLIEQLDVTIDFDCNLTELNAIRY